MRAERVGGASLGLEHPPLALLGRHRLDARFFSRACCLSRRRLARSRRGSSRRAAASGAAASCVARSVRSIEAFDFFPFDLLVLDRTEIARTPNHPSGGSAASTSAGSVGG